MGRGHIYRQTFQLLDRIGPVGRFGENYHIFVSYSNYRVLAKLLTYMTNVLGTLVWRRSTRLDYGHVIYELLP